MTCESAVPGSVDLTGHIVDKLPNALNAVLGADELALFARFGRERAFRAGEVIFRRGEIQTQMYVCLEGEVDLDFGEDLIVKHLTTGEFFGELGLLIGNHARSADAVAATACRLIELDHNDFQQLVDFDPGLIAHFLRRTILRVVNNEQLLIRQLRRRNHDLEQALDNLHATSHQLNQTEELVRTDELTGLYNRRGLALHLQDCRRSGRSPGFGLLLVDCDRFKHVNDEYGHIVGDRVLQNVAQVLRSVMREGDLACRLGGDEFCMFVGVEDERELYRIGERVIARVQGELERAGDIPHICSVSIGISVVDGAGGWNEWYARADNALYEAKRLGGNRLHGMDDAPTAAG
ncbi:MULTISPECIES: GGDEF domain-containing protein [Gammaproteobacteria]|jgi:diguanylate cyclase (GGDEF)-like protein|uniref:diguanylate cyclase n=1 Tax=Xanthomonas boreopolis TaxID=86183 RepID=A0A919F841_9XANT|nr:GGDEF domain-containing protein [Pseudomonas sp. Hp2]GHH54152.1 cyclic nucleotide-binding protein [[Pseudomonas] boreopolis]